MRRSKTTHDFVSAKAVRADGHQVHTHREVVATEDVAMHAGKDAHAYQDIIRGMDRVKI